MHRDRLYFPHDKDESHCPDLRTVFAGFAARIRFDADEYFHDKQTFSMAGVEFEVLHTPGHTKGGCCFYVQYLPDLLLVFLII